MQYHVRKFTLLFILTPILLACLSACTDSGRWSKIQKEVKL